MQAGSIIANSMLCVSIIANSILCLSIPVVLKQLILMIAVWKDFCFRFIHAELKSHIYVYGIYIYIYIYIKPSNIQSVKPYEVIPKA